MIDAIQLLVEKYGQKHFVLLQIGQHFEGYSESLISKIKKSNLDAYVRWMYIREDVSEILMASDIYCNASRSEAFCLAILEASLAALPTVATAVGGPSEIIIHNDSGFLCQKENSEEIAMYFNELIMNRERRREMGAKSQAIVEDKFTQHKQIMRLIELYQKAIR